MIRIGLVGAGPWAGMFTAPMLASASGLRLSTVWARRPEAAAAVAGPFGAHVATTFDDLLNDCDAVAFTVPPNVQAELAPRAAAAGKHLLLEKPLAFSVEQAEAIAAAADAAGVTTQLMLTYRFTPAVRDFLAAVQGSTVRHLRGAWVSDVTGSPFATPWRLDDNSALFDVGPHVLDLVEAAGGAITEVRAATSGPVLSLQTRHAGGALGQVVLSVTTPGATGPLEASAVTDAGRFVLPDPTPYTPGAVQQAITDTFARTVSGDLAPTLDVHRGVRLQHLIAAALQSQQSEGGAVLVA